MTDVLAAGAVVFAPGKHVLLVHRPRYDDWSFPKGKLDPGEHPLAAAVREVAEETGLHVRLGVPLTSQRYAVNGGRMKTVRYWVARVLDGPVGGDVDAYQPNAEIDRVAWVPYAEALTRLTYPHDRATLEEAHAHRRPTRPLIVLRHGQARARRTWTADDRRRPLVQAGHRQAARLVPMLAAYDVTRIVTSSSTRCVQTIEPYADLTGLRPRSTAGLSEKDATAASVLAVVDELVDREEPAVLCTHRPVLPSVFDALGLPDPHLDTGAMLVVHLRHGEVVATELHSPDRPGSD